MMYRAYVKTAAGFVWLVGRFADRETAQAGIDTFIAQLTPGYAVDSFIVLN